MKLPICYPPHRSRAAAVAWCGGFVLSALLLLAGCSKSADVSASAAPQPEHTYAAVARGKIDIEGGLLALSMPRAGILAKITVHEGDYVKKGQLLAALNTRPAQLAVDTARAQLEQARAQLRLLEVKRAAARHRAKRLIAAAAAGAGDGQSADDARAAVRQLGAEQVAAHAAADIASQRLIAAQYDLQRDSLYAPFDALVVRVAAQPGASVSPSSGALFTLLPEKPRIVRAELNENFVGLIHPGMRAEVVADNDAETAHWSAHVLRVGQVYGAATLVNDPQVRANARAVECVLAFDRPQYLRIGERVIVRFFAENTAKD